MSKEQTSPLAPQSEAQASPIPGMSLQDYTANLRKTTQATRDMNAQEAEYCRQNIAELENPELDKLQLPILVHNFILLAPKYRFDVLDSIELLLREVVRSARVFSKERTAAVKVINDIKEVKKLDKDPDYPQVDISQFLTAYFHFMFIGKHEDNHEQRTALKHIREYMIDKLKVVLSHKEKVVSNCDEILSKKLAGE